MCNRLHCLVFLIDAPSRLIHAHCNLSNMLQISRDNLWSSNENQTCVPVFVSSTSTARSSTNRRVEPGAPSGNIIDPITLSRLVAVLVNPAYGFTGIEIPGKIEADGVLSAIALLYRDWVMLMF